MLNATKKNMARTWFRRGALWREKQRDDYPDRDPDPGRDPDPDRDRDRDPDPDRDRAES